MEHEHWCPNCNKQWFHAAADSEADLARFSGATHTERWICPPCWAKVLTERKRLKTPLKGIGG